MTASSAAAARLLSRDVRTEPGSHEPVEPDDVIDGSPTSSTLPLSTVGAAELGIWEITAGTVRDTEADEIFVVIEGTGTVEFDDGTVIDLAAGVAVRLFAGDRTTWHIRETLRKIYVTAAD